MGQGYSKEEMQQVQKIEKMIEIAIQEENAFERFVKARNQLKKIMQQQNSLAFKPIIDYIKQVIKSKNKNGEEKFRALILFKELLKEKSVSFVNYSQTKILPRLSLMISSSL